MAAFKSTFVFLAGALGLAAVAHAQGDTMPTIKWDAGIATYYQYQFNNPKDTNRLAGRSYENLHNTPTVDLFALNVGRLAPRNGFGFQSSWIAGNLADELHYASGNSGAGEARFKSVGQLYGTYKFPCDDELWFGKFYSPFGIEQVEPWRNPCLSHSNVYEALPHYNFGIGTPNYTVGTSGLHLKGFVVNSLFNGPDLGVQDNDDNKDFILGIGYTPTSGWMLPRGGFTFGYGREKTASGYERRCLSDLTLHYDREMAGVWDFEFLYGTQKPSGSNTYASEYKTYGYNINYAHPIDTGIGHLRYDRLEYKTGGSTTWRSSITGNYEHKIDSNTMLRLEYRHDMASGGIYTGSSGTASQKSDDTLSIGLMRTNFKF